MLDQRIKKCSLCGQWLTAHDVIYDPRVKPIGMAFMDADISTAYYFFQHNAPNCGTSFLVNVQALTPFITEAVPPENKALTECCERHCVSLDDLRACRQECYYAPFRRFLHRMIALKEKTTPPTPSYTR